MTDTRRSHRARGSGIFVPTSIWAAVFSPTLVVIAYLALYIFGLVTGVDDDTRGSMQTTVLFSAIVVSAAYFLYQARKNTRTKEADAALTSIASARGMQVEKFGAVPAYLKPALGEVGGGTVRDGLVSTGGRSVRLGTYQRPSAADGKGFVQDWGFLALRLDVKLPNIQLEAVSSRTGVVSQQTLAAPSGNQVLSLEGDFDDHFRLYCPVGYETDALYIFTPDLMALLIDEAGDLSVQLIDDVAVFSRAQPFDFTDEALADRLFRIVDIVGAKTLRQTARYADDRSAVVGDVADQGRRLARRVPRWPTLTLWYSLNALLALAIAAAVVVVFLGADPAGWMAGSSGRL